MPMNDAKMKTQTDGFYGGADISQSKQIVNDYATSNMDMNGRRSSLAVGGGPILS